jgi:hypothetical protein
LIFANFVGNGTDRFPLFWGYVLGAYVRPCLPTRSLNSG